ncbi:DNL-type zinc finger protein [Balamuthia mandrillaris]
MKQRGQPALVRSISVLAFCSARRAPSASVSTASATLWNPCRRWREGSRTHSLSSRSPSLLLPRPRSDELQQQRAFSFSFSQLHARRTLCSRTSPSDNTAAAPGSPSSNDSSSPSTPVASFKPKLLMHYTCRVCNTREAKSFYRQSYERGVVIIRCSSCRSLHLIADNLNWFGRGRNVEEILMEQRGEKVTWASSSDSSKEQVEAALLAHQQTLAKYENEGKKEGEEGKEDKERFMENATLQEEGKKEGDVDIETSDEVITVTPKASASTTQTSNKQ